MYYLKREARVDVYTPSQNVSVSQAASFEQRREAEREQKDDECLEAAKRRWRVAKAANNTAAVDAAHEAWRASKDVVAAKPEEKKKLRVERDRLERDAQEARCQCPSTCVLIMVPSYRRLCRGSSASSR